MSVLGGPGVTGAEGGVELAPHSTGRAGHGATLRALDGHLARPVSTGDARSQSCLSEFLGFCMFPAGARRPQLPSRRPQQQTLFSKISTAFLEGKSSF